jgi:lipoate-protein ligase A
MSGPSEPVVRWIPPSILGGAWQMAIDEALLEAEGPPVLRFYGWARPTLSLGYHQRQLPPHWLELAAAGVIDLVRRPSGGRAVLHAGDLTYALIWPSPPAPRRSVYSLACRWLQEGFAALGEPLHFGMQTATGERASCFTSSTAADLVCGNGAKRIGSAQLWRWGHLLQHGSIQLTPPTVLWWDLFGGDPPALPPLPLGREELIVHLRDAAHRHLPFGEPGARWQELDLSVEELAGIAPRLDRYRLSPRDTSPELTIARAT